MYFTERMSEIKDEAYGNFQSRIVPNIGRSTILGIRIPVLKSLAKEYFNDPAKEDFFNELPHRYYEENHLHIMLLCLEKDFNKCVEGLDKFLPYADNWAVTDQSSPKCFKKHHDELVPVLTKWLNSDHVYTARYAINIFMREFLDQDFDIRYAELISKKQGEDYYLKMIIAWYFATALAKQYDAVIPFIEQRRLEPWIHNKAIQKAIESFRVTDEHKSYLRTLKIKK